MNPNAASAKTSVFNIAVLVAALGYFVDIYDLLMFSIIRVESLKDLGLTPDGVKDQGLFIINVQMLGLLIGGILWGVLADKKGRLSVLFASIILYSLGNIANGFVQNVPQYALVRFISGIGLAGELGAGITLVSELLPKDRRGVGTALVAGIGLSGAVVAFFVKETFHWRTCYFIGGGLGFLLLFLRIKVAESGMFNQVKESGVSKGNFLMFFNNGKRFRKYILAILIGLPTWFVIGILVSFSREFAAKMNVQGEVDPGKAIMYAYAAISLGDIAVGLVSQVLRSRKKALYIFYGITIIAMIWFFNLQGASTQELYWACALLGFGTGFWAIFVTMAAEQFGTNLRGTAATTVPNMVRGSLNLISLLFTGLQVKHGYVGSGVITAIVIMVITLIAAFFTEETFGKDLNYVEV
ncbi:MFS transporter [Flavihumibacter petaseus]|uniref:Putative major facilitator superfamily transporter n=1 Tax=Flavihumibacter petaseus NBRC 106054 TaxID=1220578 RepID=A0A0E9MZ90_9BACT|nr:MFS transporter [Flavihumibacter petaseus]GAO42924.1 putative major facilitator superfamily transporter [Flavihumibacter petaseus NBRC 106054]